MTTKKKNGRPRLPRGYKHSVEFIASELGVDRKTLERRCEEASVDLSDGLKFSEAYNALSLKSVSEAARRRRNLAEAEASEIDTLNKKGQFMFRELYVTGMKDIAVQTRVTVERAGYIPKDSRKRLIEELKEIKPAVVEASRK